MVEDVIRGQLQALPSSSPPSCPSWSAVSHSEETNSVTSPLKNISEVSHEDYSGEAENTLLAAGVRSLKLRRPEIPEGRCCLGLTLGVLVPLVLATLIILRSAGVSPAQHNTGHNIGLSQHAYEEHVELSVPALQSDKSAPNADWSRRWDAFPSKAEETTADAPGALGAAVNDASTFSAPDVKDADSETSIRSSAPDKISTTEKLPSVESTQTALPQSLAPTAVLRGSGGLAPVSATPWYFYIVYVFCVVTGIAWAAFGVNECRTRSY